MFDLTSRENAEDRLFEIIRTQNEVATSDLEPEKTMQLAADRALRLTGPAR